MFKFFNNLINRFNLFKVIFIKLIFLSFKILYHYFYLSYYNIFDKLAQQLVIIIIINCFKPIINSMKEFTN